MKLGRTLLFLWFLALPVLAEPRPVVLERDQHQSVRAEKAMVIAGEPEAAEVGRRVMRDGGNAIDAMVATAFALAVTHPRAGALGGGGFALVRTPKGEVLALDFRERAPMALHRDYYQEPGHSSVLGPTSVGVPGTTAGLWEMHQRYGQLPWSRLLAPAQKLAEDGFLVSPWLNDGLTTTRPKFMLFPSSAKVFLPDGKPPAIGTLFRQKDLARTLERIADQGPGDFYRGRTAELIADAVQGSGGAMTRKDLADYRAVWRKPVEGQFRGYTIHSMPPPSSGGVHLVQMLKLVEEMETDPDLHNGSDHIHWLTEAMRLAYVDRAQFLGDPDFVKVPVEKLVSDSYLKERRKLIRPEAAGNSRELAPHLFLAPPEESSDTTHLSAVDEQGYAVSLTYTLNFSYGSAFVAEGTGILLNNELDDFTVIPGQPNAFGLLGSEANQVEGGKRPLSSMTPTIVTKNGKFVATVGAPGGSRIITSVFQWILNYLGFGFNPQTAAAMPRIHHQWYPDELRYEYGISSDTREVLRGRGHQLKKIYAVGHVLAIVRHAEGYLEAALDPRRPAASAGY